MGAPAFAIPWRFLVRLLLFLALILAANHLSGWVVATLDVGLRPSNENFIHRMIMLSVVAYAGLLALPFVPGVEIGFGLIAMFGPRIVPLVYLCTVIGLSLSFLIGRLLPVQGIINLLAFLKFRKAGELLRVIEPMSRQQRLEFLVARAPIRFIPYLLRHRYLALGLLLNLPGNFLIGGGGGITLVAGVSRLYSIPGFLLAIALAVAPVPVLVLLFGDQVIASLAGQ